MSVAKTAPKASKRSLRANALGAALKGARWGRNINGTKLVARLHHSCWFNKGRALVLALSLRGSHCTAKLTHPWLKARQASEAAVQALLQQVRLAPCLCCGQPTFDPASVHSFREGLCAHCYETHVQTVFDQCVKEDPGLLNEGFCLNEVLAEFLHALSTTRDPGLASCGRPAVSS